MIEKHLRNLRTLADFLMKNKADIAFDMYHYAKRADTTRPIYEAAQATECGTVCCAAGHGPAAGLKAQGDENWNQYVHRTFGLNYGDATYLWLFHPHWTQVDNTPEGAARRIYWYLDKGLPSSQDIDDILYKDGHQFYYG